jgi:hypothetical protein
MMKSDLIAHIGPERWLAACSLCTLDASRTDYGEGPSKAESDVPHELADLIWQQESLLASIGLFFSIYDDMPSYGHVMYVSHHYDRFGQRERRSWWEGVRERIGHRVLALANPLVYSLWCDYFEDAERVREAWSVVTSPPRTLLMNQRVLAASGPVPYPLKRAAYVKALRNASLHPALLRGLRGSAFDVYGQIDTAHALRVFQQLAVPHGEVWHQVNRKLRAGVA